MFDALGGRVQRRREAYGLSREALGRPHFTENYIAAIERGMIAPSTRALERLAQRLDLPAGYFSTVAGPAPATLDLAAVAEDLNYQLDYANLLRHQNDYPGAQAAIDQAEQWATPYLPRLPANVRYRIPYLRGVTHLNQLQPLQARQHLEAALDEAGDDEDAVLRTRNFLGVAFYELEQPQLALRQHLYCVTTLRQDQRWDLNLRLSVYRNLANAYWALDDIAHALDSYEEALAVLKDLNEPERKAGVYWGLSMAYKAIGEWTRARLCAAQALGIYERYNHRVATAKMCMNLAEIAIETAEGGTAEGGTAAQWLARADVFLTDTTDPVLLSNLYLDWAQLARQQGNAARARQYIEVSLAHSETATHQEGPITPRVQWYLARSQAEVLYTAALIEEDQRAYDTADRFFVAALERIKQTGFRELAYRIHQGYAEALAGRGDHVQAARYTQEAAQYGRRL